MLHIYYGMGKGKTSTLNGSAIRAKGAGMKVIIFRFLKGRKTSEDEMLEKLGIDVIKTKTSKKFVIQMSNSEKDKTREELYRGLQKLKDVYENFDLIILDEFIDLLADNVNLISTEEIIYIIKMLSEKDVMISGHNKYNEIFKMADLITHYTPEKHYFEKGIVAKKGIEF